MTIQLIQGDCLVEMAKMAAGSVQCIIADPPYGLNDGSGKVTKRKGDLVTFNAGEWDNDLPLVWLEDAGRLIQDGCWIATFTDKLSVKPVWERLQQVGFRPKQTFYWIKNNPPPQPRSNFASGVETAVVATKGAVKKWNGGGWELNYFFCPIVTSDRTPHPTQKPVAVMKYLIELLSYPDDTILDPFMGSGTTMVACIQTGRNGIGIELDAGYFEIAQRRVAEAQLQVRMPI